MKKRLVIEIDEEGNANIVPHNVTMKQLAVMIGTIQIYAGRVALTHGTDLDTIKDQLLDVHFAAMDFLTGEAAIRSRSVGNGGDIDGKEKKDDSA